MEKITGIGGVFFKAEDADALRRWYQEKLGIDVDPSYGGAQFGDTVWSIFPASSKGFDPSSKPYMINYRVRNLDAMLAQLRAKGADVAAETQDMEGVGRFSWVTDPEGNRIELWQPA